MSVNSERKPFSVSEFLGGGIALATVALIAFGGLRVAQPQNSTRDVQSPDTRLGTGNSTPIESNGAKALRPPVADRSEVPTAGRPVGLGIQQHGIVGDSLGVTDVIWGPPL